MRDAMRYQGGGGQILALLLAVGGAIVAAQTIPGYDMTAGAWKPWPEVALAWIGLLVTAVGGWMARVAAPAPTTSASAVTLYVWTCQECGEIESHPFDATPTCHGKPMSRSGPAVV